ncbi:MAG: hypothetical protein V4582_20265 [Pseudomonadota bacterium]
MESTANNKVNNMRKPGKTRIMVQLWGQLATVIARDFKALHIKRDAYLNDLFKREIENLATEVTFRNSDMVRETIQQRRLPNRVKLTLELDESVVERIDWVLQDKNIARDSFVNRVLFFLVAKKIHLDYLGVAYENKVEAGVKPLDDAWGYLHDPFFQIRSCNEGSFYTAPYFADGPFGPKGPNLFGLNTAISDASWELMNCDVNALFLELDMLAEKETCDGHD